MKLSKLTLIALPATGIAIAGMTVLGAGAANASSGLGAHIRGLGRPQARYEARLDRAVTNGKLTSAQESAILAEHNLLKTELKKTPKANRRAEWQTVKTEAQTWATQHNIDVHWLVRG